MEKKTIVTHKSPDLDSCVAIWILKRFIYPKHQFEYIFVDVGEKIDTIQNTIHVDTGGIDYDHHDTNEMISSASLVYSRNKLKDNALRKMIDYVILVDHGKTINRKNHFMSIVNALNGLRGYDSLSTLKASLIFLDGIYNSINLKLKAFKDFKKGIYFKSVLGNGMGFNTDNSELRKLVYQKGYSIFLFKDKRTGFAGFKANGHSDIDFTNLYIHIKEKEPKADWFLHSSNQLLLCGSSKAPQKRLTKFSLKQLITIIKTYAKK